MSDTSQVRAPSAAAITVLRIFALVLLIIGVVLLAGGVNLLRLGGSPYYILCGAAVAISAVLLWLRRAEGALLYGLMLCATVAWAVWESGYDGWALMPRIIAPAVLGLMLLIPAIRRALIHRAPAWPVWRAVAVAIVAVGVGVALRTTVPPHIPADPAYQAGVGPMPSATNTNIAEHASDGEWLHYGKDANASRFAALSQITPENIGQLELVWQARIGPAPTGLEVTPLKIGNRLYACNTVNDIIALDAETGKEIWRYAGKSDLTNAKNPVCRGVTYYQAPDVTGICAGRLLSSTIDGRLLAVDVETGVPCPGFGDNGIVSLKAGLGEIITGYYKFSSAPTLIGRNVVVAGSVADNQFWGEPSGVVRGYDAVTGELAWAWDVGRPDRRTAPPEGETYTLSTPNAWAPMAADEALGLVYVSTGNSTPDYFGGYRRPFDDQYSTSIVALEGATGIVRWSFQTVHHDLWDYDIPSGATLLDVPQANGIAQALIVPTKTGDLFMLDRVTGKPISPVEERPVPQTGIAPEERVSPTQPFSVGLPSFRGPDLTENAMWGITPLDQLWCRIKFREARYEGIYTPPGPTPAIHYPGVAGGMEWGGVALDPRHNVAIINSTRMPQYVQLISRKEADALGLEPHGPGKTEKNFGKRAAQANTPYALLGNQFFSPLTVLCNQPPYGQISAVDLVSRKLIWTHRFGTARTIGPTLGTWRVPSHLDVTLGTFNMGGAVVTGGGVFFIGATQDRYLRGFETATGKELWKADLPAAGTATLITYLSPESGRQFVLITAAGALGIERKMGDYLMAYALPKAAGK